VRCAAAPRGSTPTSLCVWLFSASWFYDLYIVLRDGSYSPYWLPNLFLSSILYIPIAINPHRADLLEEVGGIDPTRILANGVLIPNSTADARP